MSRRQFLQATALSAAAAAVTGCAINPVTGESELMLFSEADEVKMDREGSPHQFSADYGPVQDPGVNAYVTEVGRGMAGLTHRPQMPYSYRCLNASYVNAYTFPGGSMATTRGILLSMEDEAELAAVLGHEMGHVNARHVAHAMSQKVLISGALAGAGLVLERKGKDQAALILGLGALGSGLLLARYSRDNERQADELGMEYMVRAGHNPAGMIGVMDKLRKLERSKPNAIEQMFASHPMSEERYKTAVERVAAKYPAVQLAPLRRERFMDHTAPLRRIRGAVDEIQRGDREMGGKAFDRAEPHYASALRTAPEDYEALLKMAKCQMARERPGEALRFAAMAKAAYPQEAQACHVSGIACIAARRFEPALAEFGQYDAILPGNPNIVFFKGLALEGMGRRSEAADHYTKFVDAASGGEEADYARTRLTEWGYLKPEPPKKDEDKEEDKKKRKKKKKR